MMTRDEVVAAMAERGLTRVKTLGGSVAAEDWDPYGLRSSTWQSRAGNRPQEGWYGSIEGDEAVDGQETNVNDHERTRRRWKFLPATQDSTAT